MLVESKITHLVVLRSKGGAPKKAAPGAGGAPTERKCKFQLGFYYLIFVSVLPLSY